MAAVASNQTELTLSEQTLLIALDDEKGRDTTRWAGDAGLAAGLLLDLARLELVGVDAEGKIVAHGGRHPDHQLLRDAHAVIRESAKRHDAKGWVGRLPRELGPLRERVAHGLVERGVLFERHPKLLGVLPTTRFPAADDAPEREMRERLHAVLLDGREPTEQEALLIGLLEPLGLIDGLVRREERRAARRRAKEVAEQGIAGTAVRDAVRAVQAAVGAVAVVTSSSS